MGGRALIQSAIDAELADMASLSRAIGRNPAYIQQFLKRSVPQELPEKVREKLAPILAVSPDDLREMRPSQLSPATMTVITANPSRNLALPDPPPPNARLAPEGPAYPAMASLPRDVPVWGAAQGGEDGAFHLNLGERIDWVRRPPGLSGLEVFAIYIEGNSMAPWREEGQFVYVHPTRPVRIGDYVVVVVPQEAPGQPPLAYVKRLVRRTASQIIVSQYNPPKELTFPNHQAVKLLRVIDWDEALGV